MRANETSGRGPVCWPYVLQLGLPAKCPFCCLFSAGRVPLLKIDCRKKVGTLIGTSLLDIFVEVEPNHCHGGD